MQGIVVGTDGSDSSSAALRWALDEATAHGMPVTAVLAWGFLDQRHADLDAPFDPDYSAEDAAAALDAYVERAVGSAGASHVEQRPICDLPARALLEAADGASLLVLGARGLGGFKGLLLGSVSQHCLHHATSPVAIVRAPATRTTARTMDEIVVGVDGSLASREALHWAVREARVRQANLQVILSWRMPYITGFPYTGPVFDPAVFEQDARTTLDDLLEQVDTTGIPQVDRIVTMGEPAVTLLSASKDADLLVVGSRGLGGFAELLLGSVSHHLAHHATCPLVVIPPTG